MIFSVFIFYKQNANDWKLSTYESGYLTGPTVRINMGIEITRICFNRAAWGQGWLELTTSSAMRSRKLTWVPVGKCASQSYNCDEKQHLQVHDCGQLRNVICRRGKIVTAVKRRGRLRRCVPPTVLFVLARLLASFLTGHVALFFWEGWEKWTWAGKNQEKRRFLLNPPRLHFASLGCKTAQFD